MDRRDDLQQSIKDAIAAETHTEGFERALGQLIIAWADTEEELYRLLIRYAGVTDAVARALFGGSRASAMMDMIKAIVHNAGTSKERKQDLEHVFPQMSAINKMRDHLAHYVSDSYSFDDPKKRLVENFRKAKYGNSVVYEIGEELMKAMIQDLYAISNHLNVHSHSSQDPFQPWRENPEDAAPTPWLYKLPRRIDTQDR